MIREVAAKTADRAPSLLVGTMAMPVLEGEYDHHPWVDGLHFCCCVDRESKNILDVRPTVDQGCLPDG